MYTQHFGLQELPFGITPDTSYFFSCPASQIALNTLLVAAGNGEGFIKITGEVGTGKTLLCRKFIALLDDSFVSAYIPNPYLEPRTLMLALADELEIRLEKDTDQHQLLKEITFRLMNLAQSGKKVILCLDEAQAMPLETLEALRLLTNLETEKRKLLQIVLFGQPELDDKLQSSEIRQLTQRITFHCDLGPLTREDLDSYIAHRLQIAGFSGKDLFGPAAVKILYRATRGVPRLVNILAHKALMLAYGEGVYRVEARHIREAADDSQPVQRKNGFLRLLGAVAALVAMTGTSWAYFK